jgi:AcrR family transcriptional regulator
VPKPTFHNLPERKRRRIIDLAIEEFARQPYDEASLSRIVARAGIAKGSIYQYFDNKLDLYRWLLTEEVPRRKLAAMRAHTDAVRPATLAALLRALVLSGVRFLLDNPRLSQLGSAVTLPTSNAELRELHADVRNAGHEAFKTMLAAAVARGELRSDVDVDLLAHVLGVILTFGVRDIVLGRIGVDLYTLSDQPDRAAALRGAALEGLVDDTVSVVLFGVARAARAP